jgi:hypothetical protein
LDSTELTAKRVATTSGEELKPAKLVETHSKSVLILFMCRFEGTYSFIGNGIGKGKTMTYAEAWKGMPSSIITWL